MGVCKLLYRTKYSQLLFTTGIIIHTNKGVVHFKKTFADNLLTPMSSKISTFFFLQSKRN